jgi:hypothetical protein
VKAASEVSRMSSASPSSKQQPTGASQRTLLPPIAFGFPTRSALSLPLPHADSHSPHAQQPQPSHWGGFFHHCDDLKQKDPTYVTTVVETNTFCEAPTYPKVPPQVATNLEPVGDCGMTLLVCASSILLQVAVGARAPSGCSAARAFGLDRTVR